MMRRWLPVAAWCAAATGAAAVGLATVSDVREVVADEPVEVLSEADVDRLLGQPDEALAPLVTLAAPRLESLASAEPVPATALPAVAQPPARRPAVTVQRSVPAERVVPVGPRREARAGGQVEATVVGSGAPVGATVVGSGAPVTPSASPSSSWSSVDPSPTGVDAQPVDPTPTASDTGPSAEPTPSPSPEPTSPTPDPEPSPTPSPEPSGSATEPSPSPSPEPSESVASMPDPS